MQELLRPAIGLVLAVSAAPAAAHDPELSGKVETTEVAVRLGAETVSVPHEEGRVEVSFAPAFGSVRARLAFAGGPVPRAARLRLPMRGGHLDVGFRVHGGRLISTRALSKLVDGTVLELDEPGRTHRLVLRDRR